MRTCPRCLAVYHTPAEFCGLDGERLLDTSHDPLVGARIDRYVLEKRLGEGGMACVYRAKHAELGTPFAVKLLYGEYASDKEFAERFRREARAAAQIDHPNVVKVFDFGSTPAGLTFMVMELLSGQPLDRVIQRELPMPATRVADIIRQIAAALAKAHRSGFVHRDVKPSNVILLVHDGIEQAKLLDFGLVQRWEHEAERAHERLTRTGMTVGTPCYMAPERMRGEPATPASDLYGLGAMLYEMLSGTPPFRGSLQEIVTKQVTEGPPALTTATGLEPLALRLLERAAEDRPSSADQVITVIDSLGLSGRTAPSPSTSELEFAQSKDILAVDPADLPSAVAQADPVIVTDGGSPPSLKMGAILAEARLGFYDPRRWVIAIAFLAVIGGGWWWWTSRPSGSGLDEIEAIASAVQKRVLPRRTRGSTGSDPALVPRVTQPITVEEVAVLSTVSASVEPPALVDDEIETSTSEELVDDDEQASLEPDEITATEVAQPAATPVATRVDAVKVERKPESKVQPQPQPRPQGRRPQSVYSLGSAIDSALRTRGLSLRDLAALRRLSGLVSRWERARAANDKNEANIAGPLLLSEIERFRIDDAAVRRKIERVGRALSGARRSLGTNRTRNFDTRYQTLRGFLTRSKLTDNDRRAAMFSAAKLEREINDALGRRSG